MMSVEDLTAYETSEPLSLGIVERVADIKGVSSNDLEPLYSVIDPDALETLFTGVFTNGHVEFSYEGCTIRAESSGEVTVVDSEHN